MVVKEMLSRMKTKKNRGIKFLLLILYEKKIFTRFVILILLRRYKISLGRDVRIDRTVYIPNNIELEDKAIIEAGAELSPGVIIKSGALCNHRIPPASIVSGNPGQVISYNSSTLLIGYCGEPSNSSVLGEKALKALVRNFEFSTVLDIGAGAGYHARYLYENGKKVTAIDFGTSVYFRSSEEGSCYTLIKGDFLTSNLSHQFDCVWACHVLEHQPDMHSFLLRIKESLVEGGILALTVPPAKPNIVGGHINFFNLGLLIYRLVLAGFSCKEIHALKYGYNISIILRKKSIDLPRLDYDTGDLDKLREYFPFEVVEGFHGDIERINWNWV